MSVRRTEGEPHDRLSDKMAAVLDAPENDAADVKAAIMLDTGQRGGICLRGYENDMDAVADVLVHLKAILEAHGKTLAVVPLGTA